MSKLYKTTDEHQRMIGGQYIILAFLKESKETTFLSNTENLSGWVSYLLLILNTREVTMTTEAWLVL